MITVQESKRIDELIEKLENGMNDHHKEAICAEIFSIFDEAECRRKTVMGIDVSKYQQVIEIGGWRFGMGIIVARSANAIVVELDKYLHEPIAQKVIQHYFDKGNPVLKIMGGDRGPLEWRFTNWTINGNAVMLMR